MIRTLWFFIQITLVMAAVIWLGTQAGEVSMSLMGYTLTFQAGVFLLALLAFILVTVFIWRVLGSIFGLPNAIATYHEKDKRKKGFRALTRGLVAVAAGDAKKATQFSKQTKSLLPEQNGLALLLEAQSARMRGEEAVAQNRFDALMKDKDAGFLGVRGLLKSALDEGDYAKALHFARRAMELHPKQPWVIKTVYALEIKNHLWSDLIATGRRARKYKALSDKRITSDRVAIHLMRSDYEFSQGNARLAIKELEQAYKLNPAFVPTVTRLAAHYIENKKSRKAVKMVERAWQENPHPDLVDLWDQLAPANNEGKNSDKILKWYEDLVAIKPDSAEGQIAAARAAMDLGYWGEAKAYLMVAEKIYPSARVFRLRAVVEQNSTHNEHNIHELMEKASEALPDKTWICKETGLTYDEWSAIAMPHESFNTIIWDIAGARTIKRDGLVQGDHTQNLLLDPAAPISV